MENELLELRKKVTEEAIAQVAVLRAYRETTAPTNDYYQRAKIAVAVINSTVRLYAKT
jgi:hypothetical protein